MFVLPQTLQRYFLGFEKAGMDTKHTTQFRGQRTEDGRLILLGLALTCVRLLTRLFYGQQSLHQTK